MEPKFQTSFIPKKQVTSLGGMAGNSGPNSMQQKSKSSISSLYMGLGVIVFIISIAAVGGAYFWKSYLISANAQYKIDLAKMEETFNTDSITKLKARNIQIDSAKRLVSNHVAFSRIFDIIQNLTISDVRFLSMDFKGGAGNDSTFNISMKGQGKTMAAVAFQSDVLADLATYGVSDVVSNAVLSSPTEEQNGSVTFSFSADISRSKILYKDLVTDSGNN